MTDVSSLGLQQFGSVDVHSSGLSVHNVVSPCVLVLTSQYAINKGMADRSEIRLTMSCEIVSLLRISDDSGVD